MAGKVQDVVNPPTTVDGTTIIDVIIPLGYIIVPVRRALASKTSWVGRLFRKRVGEI